MNEKAVMPGFAAISVAAIAALSTLIAVGIIGTVTALFQSRGLPLEELVAAERACSAQVYVSDRKSCMLDQIAVAQGERVAKVSVVIR
jgi:hypothetical protein